MGSMFGVGGGGAAAPAPVYVAPPAPGTLVQTVLSPGTNGGGPLPIPGETAEQRRQRLAMQQNNILGGGNGGTGGTAGGGEGGSSDGAGGGAGGSGGSSGSSGGSASDGGSGAAP